jgi:cell division protein FtsA
VIDSQTKVQDPLGMHGIRLEVQAHIILGAIASVQNLVKCCEMAGIKVSDIILEQLASADAVLSEDERELGVAVLDIGGGTSDLAMYQNGSIRHTFVLPVAGNHFTNDIAIGLRTSLQDAERIKKEYGLASIDALEDDTIFEVDTVYGNEKKLVQQTELVNILSPRAQELLSLIHEEIIKRKLQPFMATGLVLTGGGSLLQGMQPLAQQIFGCPVRIGVPRLAHTMPESLESPIYATAYGLLIHMLAKSSYGSMDSLSGPMMNRVLLRMKSWISDFF